MLDVAYGFRGHFDGAHTRGARARLAEAELLRRFAPRERVSLEALLLREMRAEAVSARSIAASRRAKRGVLGAKPIAAVLAMVFPFLETVGRLVVWE